MAETPGDPDALESLAFPLCEAGAGSAAAAWLLRSLAVRKDRPRAELGLGLISSQLGDRVAARRRHHRALAIDPSQVEAANNGGVAALELADPEEAGRWFARATTLRPTWFAPHGNLANVLRNQGMLRAADRACRRGLALAPGTASIWSNLAQIEQVTLRQRPADNSLQRAAILGRHPRVESNLIFARSYRPDVDERMLFATVRGWSARHAPSLPPRPPHAPDPHRRLRVGYLSADLRSHPVGWNLIGLIENHDQRRIDVYGYTANAASDGLTERFRAACGGHWRQVAHVDDGVVAEMIAADGIDILVTVAGHTDGNRLGVAGRRPATLQASIHDLTSTGLEAMDYWFTDVNLHPPDSAEFFSETLIRLPCFYLHARPSARPDELARRDSHGPVVFGSTNNPAKLNEAVLSLWAQILRGVPDSRLCFRYFDHFAHEDGRAPIAACLAKHGVSRDRIEFAAGRRERDDQLDHLAGLDIILDPFPFNGATSTFEALWMGVPVVTLAGHRFLGRVGVAHLRTVALGDLIASTPEAYVRIACRLAASPVQRAALRRELRGRVLASPLCDAAAYARNVEKAFRKMWHARCAGRRWNGAL